MLMKQTIVLFLVYGASASPYDPSWYGKSTAKEDCRQNEWEKPEPVENLTCNKRDDYVLRTYFDNDYYKCFAYTACTGDDSGGFEKDDAKCDDCRLPMHFLGFGKSYECRSGVSADSKAVGKPGFQENVQFCPEGYTGSSSGQSDGIVCCLKEELNKMEEARAGNCTNGQPALTFDSDRASVVVSRGCDTLACPEGYECEELGRDNWKLGICCEKNIPTVEVCYIDQMGKWEKPKPVEDLNCTKSDDYVLQSYKCVSKVQGITEVDKDDGNYVDVTCPANYTRILLVECAHGQADCCLAKELEEKEKAGQPNCTNGQPALTFDSGKASVVVSRGCDTLACPDGYECEELGRDNWKFGKCCKKD